MYAIRSYYGKNQQAVSIAKENYERNRENLRQGIFYAQTLADAGEIDKSLQILNGLLESNPSETDLYIHASQIYRITSYNVCYTKLLRPAYAEVKVMMKEKLKALREEIGDTDENYPHIKKVVDEYWDK